MSDQDYINYLRRKDEETLVERCARRRELQTISLAGKIPELLWEYYIETIELYITGQFSSVLLWCESILELILADKLISCSKDAKEEVELLGLSEKTRRCCKYKIITQRQGSVIADLRRLRNTISHANAGRLSSLSTKYYENIDEAITAYFYLANLGSAMQKDALKYLSFVRELANAWYGSE